MPPTLTAEPGRPFNILHRPFGLWHIKCSRYVNQFLSSGMIPRPRPPLSLDPEPVSPLPPRIALSAQGLTTAPEHRVRVCYLG